MGAVVLPDATIDPSSDLGRQLVVDLARYREDLLDEKTIRKRYRFDESTWQKLADDDELIRAVEAEAIRRIADGSVKRERSQVLVARAPTVSATFLMTPANRLATVLIRVKCSMTSPAMDRNTQRQRRTAL